MKNETKTDAEKHRLHQAQQLIREMEELVDFEVTSGESADGPLGKMIRGLALLKSVRFEELEPGALRSHEKALRLSVASFRNHLRAEKHLRASEKALGIATPNPRRIEG